MKLSHVLFITMLTVLATMIWVTDARLSVHFMLHLVGNGLVDRFVLLKFLPWFLGLYYTTMYHERCLVERMVTELLSTHFSWEVGKLKANIHSYFEAENTTFS